MTQEITDQEINRQRAEVAAGISLAEAQRNARAHNVNPAAFDSASLRDGSIAIASPRNLLSEKFAEAVGKWARVEQTMLSGQPAHLFALPRAQASLELLDGALDKLAGRKGERADAARKWLTERHTAITNAIAAYEGFRFDFTGPTAQRLITKIVEVRDAAANAEAAYATATRETLDAALLAKEHVRIADRDLGAEFAAALASLRVPEIVSAELMGNAEGATTDLERLPAKNPTCRHIATAIEQGLRAGPESILWIVFEKTPEHPLVTWRAKAAAEARG